MKALRLGLAASLAAVLAMTRVGVMHSRRGKEIKLPKAFSAWRRLISQDCD
jgi:hypothetical protein